MRVVVSTSQFRTAKAHGLTRKVSTVSLGVHFIAPCDSLFRSLGPTSDRPIGVKVIKARRVLDGSVVTFPGLTQVLPVDPNR